MRKIVWGCALLLACLPAGAAQQDAAKPKAHSRTHKSKTSPDAEQPANSGHDEQGDKSGKPQRTIYDFQLPGPDGKGIPMTEFRGKVILLVNLARNSTYNDQLPALIKLSEQFKDKGLVVIGVPCNDFGAAEPGTDAEIQKAYQDAKVPFPVMAKSLILGEQQLPLYEFLTKEQPGAGRGGRGGSEGGAAAGTSGGDVHWNYTKFLIDRKGKLVARFDPDVTPDSVEMQATLDKIFGDSGGRPHGNRPGGRQHPSPDKSDKASNADSKNSNI